MKIEKRILGDGSVRWKVRWRQGGRYRSRTFDWKGDATDFAADVRRRQQVGTLATIDSGRVSLATYVKETWAKAYRASLSESTRRRYGHLYDKHILPGTRPALTLIEITPEVVSRWQSERLAAAVARWPFAMRQRRRRDSAARPGERARADQSRASREKDPPASPQGGAAARTDRPGNVCAAWPLHATQCCSASWPTRASVRARRSPCNGGMCASRRS